MTQPIVEKSMQPNAVNSGWCVYSPDVDIYENDQELLLVVDVPGATANGTSVELNGQVLGVNAEVANECGEKASYRRQFKLSIPVDPDKITAEVKSGELVVHIGKAASHLPKRIEVTVA